MKFSSIIQKMWILIELLIVFSLLPAQLTAWRFSANSLQQTNLADALLNTRKVSAIEKADLNQDGKAECLILKAKRLSISDCAGKTLWQSPLTWQVAEAQIGDLNRDGKPEVDMVVWRPFQPWPIDSYLPSGGRIQNFHDQAGDSCHLILIGWVRGDFNELWAGSALVRPVFQIQAVDLDGDGWQELTALEGQYDQADGRGTLTVWKWNGFGFTLQDEVKRNYQKLEVLGGKSRIWLFVQ